MVEKLDFVRNYDDFSTERGFQFEFYCERCGTTFRTEFQALMTSAVSDLLGTASTIFGGIFAGDVSERVRSSSWQQSHDQAFLAAVTEAKPEFFQCPHCRRWVCRKNCWNTKKRLCKECAPDPGVEMVSSQTRCSIEEFWSHAVTAEADIKPGAKKRRTAIRATCPNCEAALPPNVNFCPDCGMRIQSTLHCSECGASMNQGAKFCPDCGYKVAKS
jgi:membrane protease subunit (stomatin/prohibitin family)